MRKNISECPSATRAQDSVLNLKLAAQLMLFLNLQVHIMG